MNRIAGRHSLPESHKEYDAWFIGSLQGSALYDVLQRKVMYRNLTTGQVNLKIIEETGPAFSVKTPV